jgi:GNAT superfamily N-acetyltransferase
VENPQTLAGMTYPQYRPKLLLTGPDPRVLGVVAAGEGPCGLSLAELSPGEPARILSLFVLPSARRQGLGGELLARLTDQLRDRGERLALAVYPTGKESTPAVERILARQGWSEPRPRLYLFHAGKQSVAAFLQAPWLRARSLPLGYTLFDWTQATAQDRTTAAEYASSPAFPHGVSPFQEEALIDAGTSLGLRENDRLVGWLVTHRVGPEMLRYTCLYIHPSTAVKGLGIRMLIESLRRYLAAEGQRETVKAAWGILADNQPMLQFVRRRIEPHLPDLSVTLTMEAIKDLTGA